MIWICTDLIKIMFFPLDHVEEKDEEDKNDIFFLGLMAG